MKILQMNFFSKTFFFSLFISFSFPFFLFAQDDGNIENYKVGESKQDLLNSSQLYHYQIYQLLLSYVDSGYVAVDFLLSKGADPNSTFPDGVSVLMYSSEKGYTDIVNLLLEKGAKPNYSDEYGINALMYASDNGNYKIAKLLIDKGANVNATPDDGNTALFAAVRSNSDSIVELLIQNNANINAKNILSLTPLHFAVGYGYPYLTNLLLANKANIDEADLNGNTPLMAGVYAGANQTTELLIDFGANVNLCDNKGNSPLMVASQFNDTALIKILYNVGADLNIVNRKNLNALSIAISNKSVEAFKLLLDLGAKTDTKIGNSSYYQLAEEQGNSEMVTYLKKKGLQTKIYPTIGKVNFYSGFSLSRKDFMADFGGGVFEPISKLMINIGYKYNPFSNRVLVFKNSTFYQFWEKRYSIYLSLQHLYLIKKNLFKGDFGFSPGLSNEFTWRYYRGYSKGSGLKWLLVPSAGLYYQREFYTVLCKWEFAKYNTDVRSNNRFSLQLSLNIPTRKRTFNKKIDWLD